MIDWLWSKSMIAVAVILMLTSVSAYFMSERDRTLREELENTARNLASFIDNVLDVFGVARFEIGSDLDSDLVLPNEIGGRSYLIELRRDSAILTHGSNRAMSHWSGALHFWWWDGHPLDENLISELDDAHQFLIISSGQTIEIMTEPIFIGGSEKSLAFSHLSC